MSVDITPNADGGVLKVIKREGTSSLKPSAGTNVKVHYVGTLENGEKFDSSRDRNSPFEFVLGKNQVIKGWEVGVASMCEGELAEFTIKSEYGYGKAGSPPKIPGDATLIFEVELLGWEAEDISPDHDGTILRTIINTGEALATPSDESPVTLHAVGTYEGRTFFEKLVKFTVNEASEVGLPEGVDKALKRICLREKCVIELKGSRYTYGPNPPSEYNLPPNAPVKFTLDLLEYEKMPFTWELTSEQKIEHARAAKEKGTKFYSENKLKLALTKYKRVEELLEYEKSLNEDQKAERDALMLAVYLNIALVMSKLNEQGKVIAYCEKALAISPESVKALYRLGTAYLAMTEVGKARNTFEQIVKLEPDNKAALQQLQHCKDQQQKALQAEQKRARRMFAAFSSKNDEVKQETVNEKVQPDDEMAVPSTSMDSSA